MVMKKNSRIMLCFIVSVLCILSSCFKENKKMKIDISPINYTVFENTTQKYSERDLVQIINIYDSIESLNRVFPIECIRKIDTGYRICYLGESSVAVLFFDSNQSKTFGKIYCLDGARQDLERLKIGSSVSKVQEIFPNGDFPFLYSGRNDVQKESVHCTKDGTFILIEYDDYNCISSIKSELL